MADAASGAVLPFSVGGVLGESSSGGRGRGGQSRIASDTSRLPMLHSTDCNDDFLVIGGMRVCSKLPGSNGGRNGNSPSTEDGDQAEHVTLGSSSSTTGGQSVTSSDAELTTADGGNGTRNGELHEMLDESSLPGNGGFGGEQVSQQDTSPLRRPHRRADYTMGKQQQEQPNQHQYFFSDPRLSPSRTRSNKRNAAPVPAANHLMAIDSTPGPFQLRFVSNGVNNARGFYLAYRQNPCRF